MHTVWHTVIHYRFHNKIFLNSILFYFAGSCCKGEGWLGRDKKMNEIGVNVALRFTKNT